MRGRKPTPTHLRVLAGTGTGPINESEPVPPGELEDPPSHFTATQRDGWTYAIEHAPKGLLRCLDRSLLAVWIVAEDMHAQATKKVAELGLIVKTPKSEMPMQNPYLPIINKQAEIMLRAASELGFTPTSRSRISFGGEASKESNRFSNNGAKRKPNAA